MRPLRQWLLKEVTGGKGQTVVTERERGGAVMAHLPAGVSIISVVDLWNIAHKSLL